MTEKERREAADWFHNRMQSTAMPGAAKMFRRAEEALRAGLDDEPENDWIPCAKRLPEDLEEVNVTWVNHDPEPYYNFVKDKPFTATAVYYKEKWYWYSSTCTDMLAEYGRNPNQEIDDGIEITAWAPLPKAYKPKEASNAVDK